MLWIRFSTRKHQENSTNSLRQKVQINIKPKRPLNQLEKQTEKYEIQIVKQTERLILIILTITEAIEKMTKKGSIHEMSNTRVLYITDQTFCGRCISCVDKI